MLIHPGIEVFEEVELQRQRPRLWRFVYKNTRRLDARVEHAVDLVFELFLHAGQDRGQDPGRNEAARFPRRGQRQPVHVGLLVHGEGIMEEQSLLDSEAVHLGQQSANVERAARQRGHRLSEHHIAVEEFHSLALHFVV